MLASLKEATSKSLRRQKLKQRCIKQILRKLEESQMNGTITAAIEIVTTAMPTFIVYFVRKKALTVLVGAKLANIRWNLRSRNAWHTMLFSAAWELQTTKVNPVLIDKNAESVRNFIISIYIPEVTLLAFIRRRKMTIIDND